MFLLHLRQSLRSLLKHKRFSVINLLGLSTGIAAVLLLLLIADYERSFDRFHSRPEEVYRVVTEARNEGSKEREATMPYPTARYLRFEQPGLMATQIHFSQNATVQIDGLPPLRLENLVFADSLFFRVFDFANLKGFRLAGDPVAALAAPNKAVLTRTLAEKYFPRQDPIGKRVKIDGEVEAEVAAVIEDLPPTTHLPFSMLLSYSSLTKDFLGGFDPDTWGLRSGGYCYVRLDRNNTVAGVEQALRTINRKQSVSDRDRRQQLYLQSLNAVHFDPDFAATNPSYTVSPKYLTLLLLLGGFILLIACVNYVNLSTSLALTRAKEVGVRKTIGASLRQLFFFYMGEALLVTTIAALAGAGLCLAVLPLLNELLQKSIMPDRLLQPFFLLRAVGLTVLVALLAGLYPALVLARFNPIDSLKSKVALPGRSSSILRKGLVAAQFTIACALIICTLVIARQMQFFHQKSLGFNKDLVVEVSVPSTDSAKRSAFQALLQNQAGIRSLTFCLGAPISDNGINTSLKIPEQPGRTDQKVKILACDEHYLDTYGIGLAAGRWFRASEAGRPDGQGIVVNEALVKLLGYTKPEDALGKKIGIGVNNMQPPIIGVVKDFHTSSLHERIGATALLPFPHFYYAAGIRIEPGSLSNTLAAIEKSFRQVYPSSLYEARFIDEQLARAYAEDSRNYVLFKVFAGLSIFLCCIGLWGLIAFVVVRKTREIGIRKVLGASIGSLVTLLSKDFLHLVAIGLLVASPIAGYFMHQWLQSYAYRVNISWWLFAATGLFALGIAFLTIAFQALRAARQNPVKNLRTE